jgi:hypothetical protein
MKPHTRASIAAASASLIGVMLATTVASNAQTWSWTYAAQTPNHPLLIARSSVSVSANSVHMEYTVPVANRNIVIESCITDLRDIQGATTIRTQGTRFLLIRFKPSRDASCASGKRPAVALPADDQQYIDGVAAAINKTCCTTARVAAGASAAPSAAQTPAAAASPTPPAASPSPSPPPLRLQDWVESEGLFSFVRIRNLSAARVTITGTATACRPTDSGCGPFSGSLQIDGGKTETVTTITSTDGARTPAFRYRYTASSGTQTASASGASGKSMPAGVSRISAQALRAAQAAALGTLRPASGDVATRPPAGDTATPGVPPRLIKRGSSRLAIGQTGTALVRLTIGANGMPQDATIVSITNEQLIAAAIETAVSSTYAPAMQNGHAVSAKYVATFSFDGEDPALSSIPLWKRPVPSPSAAQGTTPAATDATPLPNAVSPQPVAPSPQPDAPAAPNAGPSPSETPPSEQTPTPSPAQSPASRAGRTATLDGTARSRRSQA